MSITSSRVVPVAPVSLSRRRLARACVAAVQQLEARRLLAYHENVAENQPQPVDYGGGSSYSARPSFGAQSSAAAFATFETADLSGSAFGELWALRRAYSSASGLLNSGFGSGWRDAQLPELAPTYATTSGNPLNWINLARPDRRTDQFVYNTASTTMAPHASELDVVQRANQTGSHTGTITVAQPDGWVLTFNGVLTSSGTPGATDGKVTQLVSPGGLVTDVAYANGLVSTVKRYAQGAETGTQERWTYAYSGSYVSSVTLEVRDGTGSFNTVRSATYAYDAALLRSATVKTGQGTEIESKYYRYDNNGKLKFAFEGDALARLKHAYPDIFDLGDLDDLDDGDVAPYADRKFTYQTAGFTAVVGGSGARPGGRGTFVTTVASGTGTPSHINPAYTIAVQRDDDDGSTANTFYVTSINAYGDPVLNRVTIGSTHWDTVSTYDATTKRLASVATPGSTSSSGLVRTFTYVDDQNASTRLVEEGHLAAVFVQRGTGGSPVKVASYTYVVEGPTGASFAVLPDVVTRYESESDSTLKRETDFGYTFFSGTAQPSQVMASLPAVSTGRNGSGTSDAITTVYDKYGRATWVKDAGGFLSHWQYDDATGALKRSVVGVNTFLSSDYVDLPSGWSSVNLSPALRHDYLFDTLGRATKLSERINPNRTDVTHWVYDDPDHEVRAYRGWTGSGTTGSTTGPIGVYREDWARGYVETLTTSAAPTTVGGAPTGAETVTGSNIEALARVHLDAGGERVAEHRFHDVAGIDGGYSQAAFFGTADGPLDAGDSYHISSFDYDGIGRLVRSVTPTLTATLYAYDGLDRLTGVSVGIQTAHDVAPTSTVSTAAYEYDLGGVGNGNLTRAVAKPGGTGVADRVTDYRFDWRDRLTLVKTGVTDSGESASTGEQRALQAFAWNNLGEVTSIKHYDGDNVSISGTTDGIPVVGTGATLVAQLSNAYDQQGRLYKATKHSVISGTASTTVVLTTSMWYDARGNVVKVVAPNSAVDKRAYDGAGRMYAQYWTDAVGETAYADADDVDGDVVLEQAEYHRDGASRVTMVVARQRFHDATATGALTDALTNPKARVSYEAFIYDKAGRLTAEVDVGTNGGVEYEGPPTTAPARSDTELVTTYHYDAAGRVARVTDPRGLHARTEYDDLGRPVRVVEAATSTTGALDALAPTAGTNRRTDYAYNGNGDVTSLKAVLPDGGDVGTDLDVQETAYLYAATVAGGSTLDSNDLLTEIRYPDPTTGAASSSHRELMAVNRLGETLSFTDRAGNTHAYTYDLSGRLTLDNVTTLGSGVAGYIRKLAYAYDRAGRLASAESRTSADDVGNEVERRYNGFGQLVVEYQEHTGAVSEQGTPAVVYAYSGASGGANHSRLTSMTYPVGSRTLNYEYGVSGGTNDKVSRVNNLLDTGASVSLESYSYLGLGTVVVRNRPQPGVKLTHVDLGSATGDAGDKYVGLDRFGRVAFQRWYDTDNEANLDGFKYGYDRNSNRLYRTNEVNHAFDELYTAGGASAGYDDLDRLAGFARGTLSDANSDGKLDTVATSSATQSWSLDALGNWSTTTIDTNGSTSGGSTTTSRAHDRQNKLTVNGSDALTYDANGSLKKRSSSSPSFSYDAWGQMVSYGTVGTGSDEMVYDYPFDALHRRIREDYGTYVQYGSSYVTATDLYYNDRWQVVAAEETPTYSSDSRWRETYAWSVGYVDELVAVDRTDVQGGASSQRLYVQQDANFNVTSVTGADGAVVERYAYSPYGVRAVLDADFTADADGKSDVAFSYGHQGGRWDETTGTYHFRFREYDPVLGRWLQQDPARYIDGLNLYATLSNTPVSIQDPSGLCDLNGNDDGPFAYPPSDVPPGALTPINESTTPPNGPVTLGQPKVDMEEFQYDTTIDDIIDFLNQGGNSYSTGTLMTFTVPLTAEVPTGKQRDAEVDKKAYVIGEFAYVETLYQPVIEVRTELWELVINARVPAAVSPQTPATAGANAAATGVLTAAVSNGGAVGGVVASGVLAALGALNQGGILVGQPYYRKVGDYGTYEMMNPNKAAYWVSSGPIRIVNHER